MLKVVEWKAFYFNMKRLKRLVILGGLVVLVALGVLLPLLGNDRENNSYTIIRKLPHDPKAYTQGLLFHNGYLYESTGLYGESSLRKLDLDSGWPHRQKKLSARYFGEGLAFVRGVLIQLTWKAGKAFVYNSDTFEQLREFNYEGEGWGLAFDGKSLIMSDGSERLYFREPRSFRTERTLAVTDNGRPVRFLNELEYIEGEIWANIYRSFDIVRINPSTGEVVSRIDFSGILAPEDRNGGEDVLNGIAYDADTKRIFITGKRYSHIYEISLR